MAATARQVDLIISGSRKADGTPNAGGKIHFYNPGLLTYNTVWQDAAKTLPVSTVITLDANGTTLVFADGLYDILITDSDDVVLETIDSAFYTASQITDGIVNTELFTTSDVIESTNTLCTVDTTIDHVTLTVEDDVATLDGKPFTIVKTDSSSNTVIVKPKSGDTINGLASITLTEQYQAIRIESNGVIWVGTAVGDHTHSGTGVGGSVLGAFTATNATMVTPTIASFTNATHDHTNAAGGGALPASRSGDFRELNIKSDGADVSHDIIVDFTELIVVDTSGNSIKLTGSGASFPMTVQADIATITAGDDLGIDAGSLTTDTDYNVWVLNDGDGDSGDNTACVALASSSLSTVIGNMTGGPGGPYTHGAIVSTLSTNNSSNFTRFYQRGNKVYLSAREIVKNGGTDTTRTAIDCSSGGTAVNGIPASAETMDVELFGTASADFSGEILIAIDDTGATYCGLHPRFQTAQTQQSNAQYVVTLPADATESGTAQFWYTAPTSSALTAYIVAYTLGI